MMKANLHWKRLTPLHGHELPVCNGHSWPVVWAHGVALNTRGGCPQVLQPRALIAQHFSDFSVPLTKLDIILVDSGIPEHRLFHI